MHKDISWITERLPPVERIWRRSEPDFYGASHIIARQIGKKTPPVSLAAWRHGWFFSKSIVHPRFLSMGSKNTLNLVGTRRQARLLREFGYNRVEAVGLPFIYVDAVALPRRPGSLLVMPAHTLPYTEQRWDQEAYVAGIAELKKSFSTIIACVHSACVSHGYWTSLFERHGIPWVLGADSYDKNALIRMHTLFNSFEFVTTNSLGSHVAYAAYAGAKVSLFGSYAAPAYEDFRNDPSYKKYPALLEVHVEGLQEKVVRFYYPELFVSPIKATVRQDWGAEMVGAANKRSPREIARLLGWTPARQLVGYCREGFRLATHPAALYRLFKRRQFAKGDTTDQ